MKKEKKLYDVGDGIMSNIPKKPFYETTNYKTIPFLKREFRNNVKFNPKENDNQYHHFFCDNYDGDYRGDFKHMIYCDLCGVWTSKHRLVYYDANIYINDLC